MKKAITLVATLLNLVLFAAPTVTDISARQRYPWNGLVDIGFEISGEMSEFCEGTNLTVAVAVMIDGVERLCRTVELAEPRAQRSRAAGTMVSSPGKYRMVWDAAADLGEVKIDNAEIKVCLMSDFYPQLSDMAMSNPSSPWREEADGSLRSGVISHSQSTAMSVTVNGPATISFQWKVSSESWCDSLRFTSSNGNISQEISGEQDWTEVSIEIPIGETTLSWTYSKDGSMSEGSDCGWVKDIKIVNNGIGVSSETVAISLDTRIVRLIEGTERITFDPRWGDADSCTVAVNGAIITNAMEAGDFVWTMPSTGDTKIWEFTYTSGSTTYSRMLSSVLTATADGTEWTYFVVDGKAYITGCEANGAQLRLPELNGYPVAWIDPAIFASREPITLVVDGVLESCESLVAFANDIEKILCNQMELTSDFKVKKVMPDAHGEVVIPEGVTAIPAYMFYGRTGITSIRIPESVRKVGIWAFGNCMGLTAIEFPEVEQEVEIDGWLFAGCVNLQRVKFPKKVSTEDGYWMKDDDRGWCLFSELPHAVCFGCERLTEVIFPENIYNIEKDAFRNCKSLTEVTLPDTVRELDDSVFMGCTALTTLNLGRYFRIEHEYEEEEDCDELQDAFNVWARDNVSALTAITVSPLNEDYTSVDGVLYTKDMSELRVVPRGKSGAFVVPEGVRRIMPEALCGCDQLTSVALPASLTDIGSLLWGCPNVTKITVAPGNVVFCMENGLLMSRDKTVLYAVEQDLREIVLPPTIRRLDAVALASTRLQCVTLPASLREIGWGAITAAEGLREIRLDSGNSSFKIANGMLLSSDGRTLIACPPQLVDQPIPDTVKTIGECAMANNARREMTVPNGVSEIGENAMWKCPNLERIDLPGSLTVIEEEGIANCPKLKSIKIPGSVGVVYDRGLGRNQSLEQIVIPEGVRVLDGWPFEDAAGLTEIRLPHSLQYVGDNLTFGCTNITTVYWPNCKVSEDYEKKYFRESVSMRNIAEGSVGIITNLYFIGERRNFDNVSLKDMVGLRNVVIPASVESLRCGYNNWDETTSEFFPDSEDLERVYFLGHQPETIAAHYDDKWNNEAQEYESVWVAGLYDKLSKVVSLAPPEDATWDAAVAVGIWQGRPIRRMTADEYAWALATQEPNWDDRKMTDADGVTWYYRLLGGAVTIRGVEVRDGVAEITVPATFDGVAVTAIADGVLAGIDGLEKVTLPPALIGLGRSVASVEVTGSCKGLVIADGRVGFLGERMGDDSELTMTVRTIGAGGFRFDWCASCESEPDCDYAWHALDGEASEPMFGEENDWTSVAYTLDGGEHELSFTYQKDDSYAEGEDVAWFGNFSFVRSGVRLTVEGGSGSGEYEQGERVSISPIEPDGMRFDHWEGDVEHIVIPKRGSPYVLIPDHDICLRAVFDLRRYEIEVENGYGSGSHYTNGQEVVISAFVNAGQRFIRWEGDTDALADANCATTTLQIDNRSYWFTAVVESQVTIANGSGSGWYAPGETLTVEAEDRGNDWQFMGWTRDVYCLSGTGNVRATLTVPNRGVEVRAVFVRKFRVMFNVGGGTTEETEREVLDGNAIAALPEVTRAGYQFCGWWTEPNGGEQVDERLAPTDNLTLYARWRKIVTVRVANGTVETEGGERCEEITALDGDVVTIRANEIDGKEFYCWIGTTEALADVNAAEMELTLGKEDITIEATYRVRVTVVGGSGSGLYEEGEIVEIVADEAPAGMIFTGWECSADGALADAAAWRTTLTVPARAVTITARYVDYSSDIVATPRLIESLFRLEVGSVTLEGVAEAILIRDGSVVISGAILGDDASASVVIMTTGNGTLSFDWSASCQYNKDFFNFYHNEILVESKSAKKHTETTRTEVVVDNSVQAWKFEYAKDANGNAGQDEGYFAHLLWVPVPPIPTVGDGQGTVIIIAGDAVVEPEPGVTAVDVSVPDGFAGKVVVPSSVETVRGVAADRVVVKGGDYDITAAVEILSADGVVTVGEVKSEVLTDAVQREFAETVLDAASESAAVSATPGLVYTMMEGQTLEGMHDGDSKRADASGKVELRKTRFDGSGFYRMKIDK